MYSVETREINQAIKNNPGKFPAGYTYTLNNQEVAEMRSKILITSPETTENKQVNTKTTKSHSLIFPGTATVYQSPSLSDKWRFV